MNSFNVDTQTITILPQPSRTLRAFNFGNFLLHSFALVILTIILFGAFKILQIPAGQLIDWIIGLISFWWLLVVVTVPWNICFQAKETLVESANSRERGIAVNEKQIKYVSRVSLYSLITAISLHIVSAIVLFGLAVTEISPIGYITSIAALLLTALRPGIRAYEYLWARLAAIRGQILHPREDVLELRQRFIAVENQLKHLSEELDESREHSWANSKAKTLQEIQNKIFDTKMVLENWKEQNEKDHQRIARETQSAVAQLTADSQFLDHIREIIRFFKTA